ncbi:unnamed protein product, partial [Pylaiella littoralis]
EENHQSLLGVLTRSKAFSERCASRTRLARPNTTEARDHGAEKGGWEMLRLPLNNITVLLHHPHYGLPTVVRPRV